MVSDTLQEGNGWLCISNTIINNLYSLVFRSSIYFIFDTKTTFPINFSSSFFLCFAYEQKRYKSYLYRATYG